MSEPKRYSIFDPQEQENPNGAWVHYYDYARLKAEVDMLKASSRGHSTSHLYQQMAEDCARLKEEVERLTKAGDAMASGLQGMAGERPKALADEWNDAKGVQS